MADINELINELYDIFVGINSREDCKLLLEDLCTNKEVEQMAQRAYAAKLFLEGKTYTQITDEIDISSATLSRISRCINYGNGGYSKFIKTDD
ncbi:MAG: TrpR-related protein YerC/YecD [Clostridia bacterium]|nr:TrpR-related protein YerC/YecD [Clostridia bacterium]